MNATTDKLVAALRGCVAESSPAEYAETVDGAANLTAHDWIARAMATLREQDNGRDAIIGDLLDDLGRASRRLLAARATLAEYDAQPAPAVADVARVTPAGEVPGIAGQWIPRERCAMLAPLLHALLDGCEDCMPSQDWDANDSAALRMLADDLEQGSIA